MTLGGPKMKRPTLNIGQVVSPRTMEKDGIEYVASPVPDLCLLKQGEIRYSAKKVNGAYEIYDKWYAQEYQQEVT